MIHVSRSAGNFCGPESGGGGHAMGGVEIAMPGMLNDIQFDAYLGNERDAC